MQKLYTQLIGMPVFDECTNMPYGLVRDVIIDPENGRVVALLLPGRRVVAAREIERISTAVFIRDKESIVSVEEVLRVHEIYKRHIKILWARVLTQKEKLYLGRVVDYEIDTTTMSLSKLDVAKVFFFFRFQERLIPARNIVKVERSRIIVKEILESAVKEKAPAPSSAFA